MQADHLWSQRVAVIATLYFIRKDDFRDILDLAAFLVDHKHDLMHKAIGWMLRETGKRNLDALEGFLQEFYPRMPRTMLRYAIEKLPESRRQMYLKGEVPSTVSR